MPVTVDEFTTHIYIGKSGRSMKKKWGDWWIKIQTELGKKQTL